MFDSEGRVGHRAISGIVGLPKKDPTRLVEQACDHALRHHVYRYRQLRAIVERLFEQALERLNQDIVTTYDPRCANARLCSRQLLRADQSQNRRRADTQYRCRFRCGQLMRSCRSPSR